MKSAVQLKKKTLNCLGVSVFLATLPVSLCVQLLVNKHKFPMRQGTGMLFNREQHKELNALIGALSFLTH